MIIWFFSLENDKANKNLESGIFADEPTALAMRKFKRVKIDVETITDPKLRRKYGDTPCFISMDPLGNEIAMVAGKSATSRSRFKTFLGKTWKTLFDTAQKAFVKQMTGILNRLDKVSGKMTVLKAKETRLAKKPNASKARALAKEKAVLTAQETKIKSDEEEIKKSCKLKKEFIGAAAEEE